MSQHNMIHVSPDKKLKWQGKLYPCALGKGSIVSDKIEGDGATPTGVFKLRRVIYRSDRLTCPQTSLDAQEMTRTDGWCDDPSHSKYNQAVTLPFPASHEELWREDHIYDIIVILGHNDAPAIPHKGSAVFFHLAREGFTPTQGCVAVKLDDMLEILKTIESNVHMEITA